MRLRNEPPENPTMNECLNDLTIEQILYLLSADPTYGLPGIPRPRHSRLFCQECDPLFLLQSIRGRFSQDEIDVFPAELKDAFEGIPDITGSSLRSIRDGLTLQNPHQKPFDVLMTVSHIADDSETVVEATSGNLVQIHGGQFSPDEETQKLITFLTLQYLHAPESQIVLEIPGRGHDNEMASVTSHVKRLASGYGYNSKIARPNLNSSLQGAIQRSYSTGNSKRSTILTEDLGPNGLPLVVESGAGQKSRIFELRDKNSLPPHTTEYVLETILPG